MRIAIDISPLCKSRTGVAMYTYYLVRALSRIDTENTYMLYTNGAVSLDFPLPPNFFIRPTQMPLPQFQLWFHFGLPVFLRRDKIDIFHGTNFLIPPMPGCKTVSTVHDLTSITMRSKHKLFHRISHGLFLKGSLRRADRLIAVSSFTASEIERLFPGYAKKTSVILEAASPEFVRIDDRRRLAAVRAKYSLPERFILFVGTLEPRKNIAGLLRAFASVHKGIPHKLVVVGGRGWKYSDIFDLVGELGIESSITFTDYVPSGDLPAIYNLAELMVYPSFFEGFGLPPLEAMACGTPVVTSNRSSIPEVVGDAAILVNPENTDEIAAGILRVLEDERVREALIEKGLERARLFTWEGCAAKTLAIYKSMT